MGRLIKVAFIISTIRKKSGSIQVGQVETLVENGEILLTVETFDTDSNIGFKVISKKMIRKSIQQRWHSDQKLRITIQRKYGIRKKGVPPKNVGKREISITIKKETDIVTK